VRFDTLPEKATLSFPALRIQLAAVLLAAVFPSAAAGQSAQLTITVRDSATGDPIRNAQVGIGGMEQSARTNGQGVARISRIPAGNRLVSVSRLGYEPVRIPVEFGGEAVERTVQLVADPVRVRGVTATGEARDPALDLRGFYERQQHGTGAFMTADRIEELRPNRTVDLFRHLRGMRVKYDRVRGEYYVVSGRGGAGGDCGPPEIYLDGARVGFRANTFTFIEPELIAGIEAYSGPATLPVQYRSNAACGVVLIWTHMGPRR